VCEGISLGCWNEGPGRVDQPEASKIAGDPALE